jgi:hypothetical protein
VEGAVDAGGDLGRGVNLGGGVRDGDGHPARGDGRSDVVSVRPIRLPSAGQSEAAALISMIERAAANPDIDIDRIERMYAMYERAAARNSRAAYDMALADMQPELPVIDKTASIQHGDKLIAKYARWEDIAVPVTKVLAKFGFSLSFKVAQEDNRVVVTAILAHREGHREETSFPFPIDSGGAKSPIQAIGSSISYGKRYAAGLLLNIITKGEDDDAKAAGMDADKTITDKQADEIRTLLTVKRIPIETFLNYMHAESISDIPAKDYDRAKTAIAKSKGGAR